MSDETGSQSKVPQFLQKDTEEAKAYQSMELIRQHLQTLVKPHEQDMVTQKLARTHVVSLMMEDQSSDQSDSQVQLFTPETIGSIVEQGLAPRMNVIFDVDHTLIYAFDISFSTLMPGTTRDTRLLKLNDARNTQMTLVMREGIEEMFEFLEPFCTFYVYSHGLRGYIDKILDFIDPQQRYFKNRHERVLAPHNQPEQNYMRHTGKSFRDFKKLHNKKECVFTEADLERTIIIDDQYLAIHPEYRGKRLLIQQ